MTESDNRDRVIITPASAPLSSRDVPRPSGFPKPTPGTLALAGVIVALLAVAIWTVFILPNHVDDVEVARVEVGDGASDEPAGNGVAAPDVVPPFRQSELIRAEAQARSTIAEVVELQRLLEQEMNVEAWGSDAFAAALDQAIEGDRLFEEASYEGAQTAYEEAAASLRVLRDEGRASFDDAVARGNAALDAFATEDAAMAFGEALTILPNDADALDGADRAALQPKVLDLIRNAERARLRGDLERAEELLRQARSQDSLTAGLDTKIAQVRAGRADGAYREALSDAFAALERQEFDEAEAAFNRVLVTRPEDDGALAGLQQTAQRRTLFRIDALRVQGAAEESAGDWEAALSTFDAALEIDGSLQFARDGRARVRRWVEMIRDIEAILDDPPALSEDAVFDEANTLLTSARNQTGAGAAFQAKAEALAELLSRAAVPVELVLFSDNATDIVIHKVATLGSFSRHSLLLRPGRYVIVGSRDGCRDIRKEILLEAESPPVTVRCEERI